jgi:hypothetical protein
VKNDKTASPRRFSDPLTESIVKEAFSKLVAVQAMMAAASTPAADETIDGESRIDEARRLFYEENYTRPMIARKYKVCDRTVRRWLNRK